ncbi:MAG: heavy metal-binding domain-containing protein [Deltaproteobacteria bacterium]|nr:heavy metal-binding domain-containing protein [Deltaproteobacteria bacterium]
MVNKKEEFPFESTPESLVFPEFTLIIEDIEKEKDKNLIKEVLTQQEFGFDAQDIEEQLRKNKVVLTKLSEVDGTRIVMALQGIQARFKFDLSVHLLPHEKWNPPKDLPRAHEGNLFDLKHRLEHKGDPNFIMTTGNQIENAMIEKYLGIVSCQKIIPISKNQDDVFEKLSTELVSRAKGKGAHALISVQFDLKTISEDKRYAIALGTAVTTHKKAPKTQ